jgi:glycosyltransferase involved in cell wall biosynthesis
MLISILTPCRNEVGHIEAFVENALGLKRPPGAELELLIADGRSNDGCRQALDALTSMHEELQVIDNPRGTTPAALNLAIRRARGEVLVRMDVHSEYADDYLIECVRTLEESGADNVGGPWVPRGRGLISRAIEASFSCAWVSGGGRAHDPSYEGPVDTVYLGCWRAKTFERFGLFDEELIRAQDSELNLRIRRLGGQVWQSPRIRSRYEPRDSAAQLLRQYVQYGYWKVATLRKHGAPASLRQLIPGGFLAMLGLLAGLAAVDLRAGWCLAALLACYATASIATAAVLSARRRSPKVFLVLPLVFAAFHFGFGYGYLRGLLDFIVFGRGAAEKLTRLTRSPERG